MRTPIGQKVCLDRSHEYDCGECGKRIPVKDLRSIDSNSVTSSRRLYLRVLAKLMLCFALISAIWVILSPLFRPNVPVNAKHEETRIDTSALTENSVEIREWADKPLIVARRSARTESLLRSTDASLLKDVDSQISVQPNTARNAIRSAHPGWFLAIGIGTSSGCVVSFTSTVSETAVFTDACDRSQYDFAGRALQGGKAKKNLPIPNWRIENNTIIVSTAPVESD